MPYTIASGIREPHGDTFMHHILVNEVTSVGSYAVTSSHKIDRIVSAISETTTAGVRIMANSQDGTNRGEDGSIFLATVSGTGDSVWASFLSKS